MKLGWSGKEAYNAGQVSSIAFDYYSYISKRSFLLQYVSRFFKLGF